MKIVEKLLRRGVHIFNGLVAVLPFGMAVVFSAVYLFGGWGSVLPGHDPPYYFLPRLDKLFWGMVLTVVIVAVIYGVCFILTWMSQKWFRGKNTSYMFKILMIFLIAWFIRMVFICIFQEDIRPFSDFLRVWKIAHGDVVHIDYYTLFPAYMNFAAFEKAFIEIFGDRFINLIYLNGILASFTAAFLYVAGGFICSNEKSAMAIGLLYAFMPSNIVYCTVGTPEFLTIVLCVLGTLFLLWAFNVDKKKQFVFAMLGGIFVGAGSAYKPFGVIIIIAFFVSILIKTVLSENKNSYFGKRKNSILMAVFLFFIVMGGYKAAFTAIRNNTEKEFGLELDSNVSIPHYFLIGLNTEGEGQIHLGGLARKYYTKYLENGKNIEEAKQYAVSILKEDWNKNTKEVLPNMLKKMIWAFQDDGTPLTYFNTSIGIKTDTAMKEAIYSKRH